MSRGREPCPRRAEGFPGNTGRGDPAVILQSLVRTGQFRSLIVRGSADGLIILAGNHTIQALLAHGPGPCGLTTTTDDGDLGMPPG
ncbi:hypothetical protein HEP85_38890 [Streptomyces sp. RPA4-2]|uniref:hypothetical protein n=1 Tax=Streptomyces sp. RPA4-2 TaxID=2721244 RepID=UPI00143EE197|nr:hypothetical protein [Streptomyces sp. RPA4-2]QIY66410.1 hypothetical protein HEP85_38890 [Streptomyces sp. RPA4-2]